jgi:2-polyprenyl-6-methoxyphenol hydroxylase-like FAD-dependent oxidoreductase
MTATDAKTPVLVSGGGIGGLAASLALVRQGYRVEVFEQQRFYDALEWLYGWNVDNCLAR